MKWFLSTAKPKIPKSKNFSPKFEVLGFWKRPSKKPKSAKLTFLTFLSANETPMKLKYHYAKQPIWTSIGTTNLSKWKRVFMEIFCVGIFANAISSKIEGICIQIVVSQFLLVIGNIMASCR